jgi:hypothetical protein
MEDFTRHRARLATVPACRKGFSTSLETNG